MFEIWSIFKLQIYSNARIEVEKKVFEKVEKGSLIYLF